MEKKISERKIILYTSALILFAGLVRMLNYSIGFVFFYLAFLPFIFYRVNYYYKLQGKPKNQHDKYRLIILVTIIITILLNLMGVQDVEFFLLFMLMIDFLLVINRKV